MPSGRSDSKEKTLESAIKQTEPRKCHKTDIMIENRPYRKSCPKIIDFIRKIDTMVSARKNHAAALRKLPSG